MPGGGGVRYDEEERAKRVRLAIIANRPLMRQIAGFPPEKEKNDD